MLLEEQNIARIVRQYQQRVQRSRARNTFRRLKMSSSRTFRLVVYPRLYKEWRNKLGKTMGPVSPRRCTGEQQFMAPSSVYAFSSHSRG